MRIPAAAGPGGGRLTMINLPAAGDQIRNYQILGRIGAGGMGVVFNARDLKLDRIVALKFLPYTPEEKRGLLQEARLISSLDHPNICTIFGVEETEPGAHGPGQFFIVMGYYGGGTLADRIAAGPMLVTDILDILTGIASGLSAAHSHRVIHRDIKPSNILLTQGGIVKIVDFGLAKVLSSSSQTQSVDTSGTVAYMAPEQVRGGLVDHRVDIWAVGVLAAEMLSGVHPFKRDNLAAVAYSICNDPPAAGEDGPAGLRQVIYKSLSKDPALRYQTCDELLADLRLLRGDTDTEVLSGMGGVPLKGHGSAATGQGIATQRTTGAAQRKALERSILAASGAHQVAARRSGLLWIPFSLLAIAALLFAIPVVRERALGAVFAPTEKHIAVLPFENLGPDLGDPALAGGLMDSMTGALSNLDSDQKSLWVVPSSVVRSQHVDDPAAALSMLGATLIVKGSIAHRGKTVILTANLINTRTLRQIGAASSSSSDGDLAAAQQDAVLQLARLLNLAAPRSDSAQSSSSAPAAYDLYLEALNYMQRFDKPGNLDLAIDRLKTATSEDPRFALAYATEGEAYRLKYEAENNPHWLQLALANCEQATKLNPRLPSAYVTLGDIHAVSGHSELAADEFQRALSLNSKDPGAISGLAWSYEQAGRLNEAEAEYKKALVLRPADWYSIDRLALFYDRHQRYGEAIAQMKEAIKLTPDNRNVYYNLGAFYLEAGDPSHYAEAEAALKRSLSISPNYPAYGNLGLLYLEQQRYPEAAAMAEKALAINDQDLLPWSYCELAYRWLHQDKEASNALKHLQDLALAAVKLNPQDAESQSWLGLAFAKRGLRDEARPHLEAAVALAPANQQVVVNAVEAYVMIGDEVAVHRLIEQARQAHISMSDLKLDPDMQDLLTRTRL